MRYTCKYYGGSGTEYDGGIWEKTETKSTMTLTLVIRPFFAINWDRLVIKKDETKNRRHCLRDWEDGTFTVYPDRCGVPHRFEPVTP